MESDYRVHVGGETFKHMESDYRVRVGGDTFTESWNLVYGFASQGLERAEKTRTNCGRIPHRNSKDITAEVDTVV